MQRSERSFEKNGCPTLEIKEILEKQTFFGPGKRGIHFVLPFSASSGTDRICEVNPFGPFLPLHQSINIIAGDPYIASIGVKSDRQGKNCTLATRIFVKVGFISVTGKRRN